LANIAIGCKNWFPPNHYCCNFEFAHASVAYRVMNSTINYIKAVNI